MKFQRRALTGLADQIAAKCGKIKPRRRIH
jgi:hypothetical protein